ncbi:MAG: type II toxin-antitoxin system RelE/ParE family toxin [Candidatus Shapirobacteria bacterium]|jgi:phage-related protein
MRRKIVFYRTAEGRCPIEEFFDSIPGKELQKITWVLRIVEELDIVPRQYFKKLTDTDEIWECRIDIGRIGYRILCFMDSGNLVILTNGFSKKSQKTPPGEISRAERYRNDYLKRRIS